MQSVYAHVPIHQVPGRVRFIQFIRPDNGQTALPFFSDQAKAQFASGDDVSIIAMEARQLFELTRGATLILDPNDDRAVLYPEEISALLSGRPLVSFDTEKLAEPETVGVRAPTVPVEALTSTLKTYCQTETDVTAAYIVEVLRGQDYKDASLLVAIAARSPATERISRTSMQRIQPLLSELALPLLMTIIAPMKDNVLYRKAIQFYGRS